MSVNRSFIIFATALVLWSIGVANASTGAHPKFYHGKRVFSEAGCSVQNREIECASPGTGLCWKSGHDPRKGQKPWSIDVGGDGSSPDFDHDERCSH